MFSNRLSSAFLACLPLLTILLAMFAGCSNQTEIAPADEEETFMLVALPGSEGRYDEAVTLSDSLLSNCEMSDTLRGYLMIERLVALINSGKIEAAQSYADTLITFGHRTGFGEAEMQGEQCRGISFRRKELFDSAIACYRRGLDIAIREENMEMEQTFADVLAVIYAETDRCDEAHEFGQRSLRMAEELADTTAILSAVSTIGGIYMKESRHEEVIKTLRPFYPLARNASPLYLIKFLTPVVRAYIALDSVAAARETIAMMEGATAFLPPTHQASTVVLTAKASLAEHEKRYPDQWELLMAIDSLGTHGKPRNLILLEHAECLAKMGRHKEAHAKSMEAYHILDSIRHSEIDNQLSDLSVRYDTLNKEMEIQRLSRQHWILVSIILLCIILLGTGAVLVTNARRRHLRRLELEKQQEYIRGLEQERARMARELHDDVAGDLVGLQCELEIANPGANGCRLQEIADKVRRLSHELMPPQFASETLTSLLLDYVAHHNSTHNTPRLSITDEGSFDWKSLPAGTSHELYRIIQESVNNALKHSEATYITITLDGNERFSLSVTNDGVTDIDASPGDGIGTRTLRARAEIIGASIEIIVNDGTYTLNITQR